jgi:hypothetical protein
LREKKGFKYVTSWILWKEAAFLFCQSKGSAKGMNLVHLHSYLSFDFGFGEYKVGKSNEFEHGFYIIRYLYHCDGAFF